MKADGLIHAWAKLTEAKLALQAVEREIADAIVLMGDRREIECGAAGPGGATAPTAISSPAASAVPKADTIVPGMGTLCHDFAPRPEPAPFCAIEEPDA